MCTVIVRVPDDPSGRVLLLAVRDEDPERGWTPLGRSWPDTHPGVLGIRDERAGGAWLAADERAGRLAVLLNRPDVLAADADLPSRGEVVLDSVEGREVPAVPDLHGFNLVEVHGASVRVTTWDGEVRTREDLRPGTHMIAHADVDDAGTARIVRWLPEFAEAADDLDAWIRLLRRTAELPADDDRAIIRDNRPFGVPTISLVVCAAAVSRGSATVSAVDVPAPGTPAESG